MEKFYVEMADILEVDAVKDEDTLESFECWDSLTRLCIIAMADTKYKVKLSNDDITRSATIGVLKNLIISRKK